MKLVLASHNPHKAREFATLLGPHEIVPLPDGVTLPPEIGDSFVDNALDKARAAVRATALPAVADDSGIEAAALGGAPGVRSARFAGEHASDEENLAKLLGEAPAGSALAYVCALVYCDADGGEHVVEGRCTPGDFLATIYSHLGIDAAKIAIPDFSGRPIPILPNGAPIPGLQARA